MDTWLAGGGAAQKTTTWAEMPACIEKCARTFTHTGTQDSVVMVPLMVFMGTHSRRSAAAAQRRDKRAWDRKGQGKGKGKGKWAHPHAFVGPPMAPSHGWGPYHSWW